MSSSSVNCWRGGKGGEEDEEEALLELEDWVMVRWEAAFWTSRFTPLNKCCRG